MKERNDVRTPAERQECAARETCWAHPPLTKAEEDVLIARAVRGFLADVGRPILGGRRRVPAN